ncbi:hypothetical protein Sjap_011335 [Stephania japonica]|uniref:Polygalacturonase n=1 Tax=Stephania japonica TaxID=461633 RepID=A0AAP0JDB5_9MAGN
MMSRQRRSLCPGHTVRCVMGNYSPHHYLRHWGIGSLEPHFEGCRVGMNPATLALCCQRQTSSIRNPRTEDPNQELTLTWHCPLSPMAPDIFIPFIFLLSGLDVVQCIFPMLYVHSHPVIRASHLVFKMSGSSCTLPILLTQAQVSIYPIPVAHTQLKEAHTHETDTIINKIGLQRFLDMLIVVILAHDFTQCHGKPAYFLNVLDYGAVGDGHTDDSQAFLKAWNATCQATQRFPTLQIPAYKNFLLNPLTFEGPCIAPNIRIRAIAFYNCNELQFSELTIMNTPRSHISVNGCNGAMLSKLNLIAPEDSPNTDGIDISDSSNIQISNSFIRTGDDCIAINEGSSYINITNIACGPGHGISVGSLGAHGAYDTVDHIYVKNCTLTGTTNGLRIKTWQHPMFDVKNAVNVSDITYREIYGTSTSEYAIVEPLYIGPSKIISYNYIMVKCKFEETSCNNRSRFIIIRSPQISARSVRSVVVHGRSTSIQVSSCKIQEFLQRFTSDLHSFISDLA